MAVSASANAAHSRLEYDGGPPDPATWAMPICKHLGKKGIRHLGYLFRALGVPLSPKCIFAPSACIYPDAHV